MSPVPSPDVPLMSITSNALLSVAPIAPSIVTLPVPDSIVKSLAVAVAESTVEVNLTRPSPAELSIIVSTASFAAPVIVTSPATAELPVPVLSV